MQLYVYKDADEVCSALADWITVLIDKTLQVKEIFTWALSGGETPKKLYSILATPPYNEKIKWNRLHFFWGDERFVPFNDEHSNAKMAFDNLLSKVNIPPGQVHKIWTDISPVESARQYQKILHKYFDDKQTTFDLTVLGLGEDGHTLSLFPGSEILNDQQSWVKAVHTEEKGERITLMPSVVNRSSAVVFLVTGKNKAKVLKDILEDGNNSYPADLIRPLNNELYWFIDESAAQLLNREEGRVT